MRVGLDEFHIYQPSELQPTIILCVSLEIQEIQEIEFPFLDALYSQFRTQWFSATVHPPSTPQNRHRYTRTSRGVLRYRRSWHIFQFPTDLPDLTSDGRWKIQTIKKILRRWAPGSGDIPSVSHFLGLQQGMVYNYRFKNCHERI
ncbi:predicted protein [Histoplasma capsulatum H143]|uniref:Uncharacterized protein n=1 Tax=Ajellomyces capsulatus (strain H143) TaxID=544712 RepID=C6H4C2_AJECH|nr:predicted protein [Histoplasma capsulatum H143]